MIRNLVVVVSFAVAVSGCKDLVVPPPPGPGTVSGRVVVSIPGVAARQPVANASVQLVSGSVATTTDADGRFALKGFTFDTGTLRFRGEVPGLGLRQKTITLESIGAGPGHDVQLGDVVIVESAIVRGRALRGDLVDSPTGHLNSVVFVPEGPFTTYTADDGSFVLDELPEGPLQITVFRTGYKPAGLNIAPRSGEVLNLRDLVLEELSGPELPGSLRGSLIFVPAQPDMGDVTVRALLVGGGEANATIDATTSEFKFSALAPGLYDLVATRSGFATAAMRNVLVSSGGSVVVGSIVLEQGTATPFDAGMRPQPLDAGSEVDAGVDAGSDDAGTSDAGSDDAGSGDAGNDAGAEDAGFDAGFDAGTAIDAGPALCGGPADCASTEWCDVGVCRPQCSSSAMCTNARICDTMTGTCVTPCSGSAMCASDETCDPISNSCRRLCDLSIPCPSGQRCNAQSYCEPECFVHADCNSPYRQCQAGACIGNGTCFRDRDCTSALDFCIGGLCATQARVFVDGGTGSDAGASGYACSTPCSCREGEVCESSGVCVSDPLPTVYLVADGGGSGELPDAGTGNLVLALANAQTGDTLALAADTAFAVPTGTSIPRDRVTLAGGYVSCGSARWVRDITRFSTVHSPLPPVLTFAGTTSSPRTDLRLENLELRADDNSQPSCNRYNFEGDQTLRLKMHRVRSHVDGTNLCSGAYGMGLCNNCRDLDLDDLEQLPQTPAFIQYSIYGLQLYNVSGRLKKFTMPSNNQGASIGLSVFGLVGPMVLDEIRINPTNVGYATISLQGGTCGLHRMTVQNSTLAFAVAAATPGNTYGYALSMQNCNDLVIRNNLLDGSLQSGMNAANGRGIFLRDTGGMVEGNTLLLPTLTSTAAGWFEAIHIDGRASLTVRNNTVSGGSFSLLHVNAVRLMSINDLTQGPMVVEGNRLSSGLVYGPGNAFTEPAGIYVDNVPGTAGLSLRDNTVIGPPGAQALGTGSNLVCNSSYGVHVNNATLLLERNRITALDGMRTNAVRIRGSSSVELIGNALYAGVSRAPSGGSCGGYATPLNSSTGLHIDTAGTQVFALGNTIEGVGEAGQATPSIGILCSGAVVGSFKSNLVNGGRAPTHWMVGKDGPTNGVCDDPSFWNNNYFFYENPGARSAIEMLGVLVLPDAGLNQPDTNGNVAGERVSCLDPMMVGVDGGVARYRLLQGGPCIDRGDVGIRRDNSVPTIDIDGLVRVQGVRADIGCSERQ